MEELFMKYSNTAATKQLQGEKTEKALIEKIKKDTTQLSKLEPIEEKVIRMIHGIAAGPHEELRHFEQYPAHLRQTLLSIERRAFAESGQIEALVNKEKIISKLKKL